MANVLEEVDVARWTVFVKLYHYLRYTRSTTCLGSAIGAILSLRPAKRSLWYIGPSPSYTITSLHFEILCTLCHGKGQTVPYRDAHDFRSILDFLYGNVEDAFVTEFREFDSPSRRSDVRALSGLAVRRAELPTRFVYHFPDLGTLVDSCVSGERMFGFALYVGKLLTVLAFMTYGYDVAATFHNITNRIDRFASDRPGLVISSLDTSDRFEWTGLMEELCVIVTEVDNGGNYPVYGVLDELKRIDYGDETLGDDPGIAALYGLDGGTCFSTLNEVIDHARSKDSCGETAVLVDFSDGGLVMSGEVVD